MVHTKFIKEISLTNETLKKDLEEKYNLQEASSSHAFLLLWEKTEAQGGNPPAPSLSEGVEMLTAVSGFVHTECMGQTVKFSLRKCDTSMEKTMT